MTHHSPLKILFIISSFGIISSCIPGFLAKPTATPLPPTLTPPQSRGRSAICLGQEPDSLYPYGTVSPVSKRVMDVIFYGTCVSPG